MTALIPFLVFCQALGALVGAVTAVWSELAYLRAMRDGRIDAAEKEHLHIIARGLRFGMTLLLLASLGLIVAAYVYAFPQPALTVSYWTFIALSLLIISVAWALSRKHISFALGSAFIFTAWWFLVYLSFGWIPVTSFGAAAMSFIIATAIFYAVLQYARLLATPK
ncbi:MAG: hypothetical protein NUV60_00965 [Patescibacteria group bacterium]|nr:hypothetical protein [Patescibacteria group bacterium]